MRELYANIIVCINGALAQLGERFAGSEEVRSSILLGSTNIIE